MEIIDYIGIIKPSQSESSESVEITLAKWRDWIEKASLRRDNFEMDFGEI